MELRQNRKKRSIWEAAADDEVSSETLRIQKAARTVKPQALKAIPVEVPHITPEIDSQIKQQLEAPLPSYIP
jgi:hypothetical protein